MHGCEHCSEVNLRHKIENSKQLEQAIRVIAANLEDGTIVESDYWPEGALNYNHTTFKELVAGATWGDVLKYYFECPKCNSLYKLWAETYHGSGGGWGPSEQ